MIFEELLNSKKKSWETGERYSQLTTSLGVFSCISTHTTLSYIAGIIQTNQPNDAQIVFKCLFTLSFTLPHSLNIFS